MAILTESEILEIEDMMLYFFKAFRDTPVDFQAEIITLLNNDEPILRNDYDGD